MFYHSSAIIVSFLYRLTDSCDVSSRRNWTQLSYDNFAEQFLELTSVSEDKNKDHDHEEHHEDGHEEHEDSHEEGHEHDDDGLSDHSDVHHHDEEDGHEEKYFSKGQLEHMLRLIAHSYQLGKSSALGSSPRQQLDLICSFGNLKVCALTACITAVTI